MTQQDLIKLLNDDLANEYAAIVQYSTFAAQVSGPFRPQLSAFFAAEIADEQQHAQFLANKIVALGGQPTTTPAPVKNGKTNKEMLEAVLEAETNAVKNYTLRAEQAANLGLKALSIDLEDMVRDESNHKEEVERILKGWPI